ncbi:MAG: asparagine synthase (glutamine-hydrolyzing) [Deltaproteobacteria bacterium]|nr:asparagine synthase (glutamine-hydrolyzing) [Deltaproteobacteria bacterium]
MCGICGKLDFDGKGIGEDLLRKMTRSFTYRGPDDEGVFASPPIGLGHRRLSIIDLSPSGHQPMCNEDESIWLVFNGEIYDFEELREELKSKGHRLKSRTDCETIIHLYEDGGIDCLNRLNGMFAFALWDSRNQRLWLGRDRLGIKPLHYYWDGRKLVFASEIKAILCDPDVPREIDREALDLYLTLNYIPAPWTIFKNIRKLEPGNHLLAKRGEISIEPYWDIPAYNRPLDDGIEIREQKGHLYNLMEDAVKRRLISDVPLGAFLSGGIDSSIIVALMARNSNTPVKTFSIGYKDLPSFDETGYAREVARFNNTDHHEFKLGFHDILEVFPKVLEKLDEPFADSSAVPTYIVSRETRDHVKVALSGDGGDELFAGYRMYQGEYWSQYYTKIPAFFRNNMIAPLINSLPDARGKAGLEMMRRMKKFVKGMSNSFPERFYGWREIFPFSMRQGLLKEPPKENLHLKLIRKMVDIEKDRFHGDNINLMLYMDVKGLLHGDMLTKVDRMSMANSLEVRVPFLDHSVVEYVFGLRGDTKLKGRTGKYILMETFKDLLPPSLHRRPKWGFEMPIGAWLRNELKFLIDEYLDEDHIKRQDLFHYEVIKEQIDRHMSGRQDTSWNLWNLIVFQHWYRTYF